MSGVDDIIGNWVKKAERSGELKRGKYWGKPLDFNDGYEQMRQKIGTRVKKQHGGHHADHAEPGHGGSE